MAAALVGAGHGVALIPASAWHEWPGVRRLTAVAPEIHRTLYAAVRQGTREHPATGALLDLLRQSKSVRA